MADLGDLRLEKSDEPPLPERRNNALRTLFFVALVAIVGVLLWWAFWPRSAEQIGVQTDEQRAAAPAASAPSTIPGDEIDLPPLPETDPIVRQLVGQLSAHPKIAAWLATDQLVRNFAVVVVNIADGRSPAQHLRAVPPQGQFVVSDTNGTVRIDPRSYRRYDDYAEAIGALDPEGTARLYATLKPRLQDAYRELGYPDQDFDRAMGRAVQLLLNTPVIDVDIELVPKSVSWEFADPKLQSLTSAQRQFLRMGPRNMRIVQAKLREIAPLAGWTP